MAVGPSQLHVMPHTAITIISTKRCLRLRVCRGSESDSKYDPIDSTFTHLVAIRYILAGAGRRRCATVGREIMRALLISEVYHFAGKSASSPRPPIYARWPWTGGQALEYPDRGSTGNA